MQLLSDREERVHHYEALPEPLRRYTFFSKDATEEPYTRLLLHFRLPKFLDNGQPFFKKAERQRITDALRRDLYPATL